MTYTVLGIEKTEYSKRLKIKTAVSFAALVLVILLNVLLCVFRTESTHTAFLIINIVSDVAAIWFVYFYIRVVFIPQKRLLGLSKREEYGQVLVGRIADISDKSKKVSGFDCYELKLSDGDRTVFLIADCNIPKEMCGEVKLHTVDNIVVAAEVEDE